MIIKFIKKLASYSILCLFRLSILFLALPLLVTVVIFIACVEFDNRMFPDNNRKSIINPAESQLTLISRIIESVLFYIGHDSNKAAEITEPPAYERIHQVDEKHLLLSAKKLATSFASYLLWSVFMVSIVFLALPLFITFVAFIAHVAFDNKMFPDDNERSVIRHSGIPADIIGWIVQSSLTFLGHINRPIISNIPMANVLRDASAGFTREFAAPLINYVEPIRLTGEKALIPPAEVDELNEIVIPIEELSSIVDEEQPPAYAESDSFPAEISRSSSLEDISTDEEEPVPSTATPAIASRTISNSSPEDIAVEGNRTSDALTTVMSSTTLDRINNDTPTQQQL